MRRGREGRAYTFEFGPGKLHIVSMIQRPQPDNHKSWYGRRRQEEPLLFVDLLSVHGRVRQIKYLELQPVILGAKK